MPVRTLDEICIACETDKGTVHPVAHGYAPRYERVFDSFRNKPIKMLEIGVGGAQSIRAWLEYFPKAQVFGLDNNPDAVKGPYDRYTFVLGDQSNRDFWSHFVQSYGSDWDLIIDDGGHFSGGIVTSFECMWPHIKSGGLYAIEDLGCAYGQIFQTPGFPNHMDFIKSLAENANKGERSIHSILLSRELAILTKA